MTFGEPLHIYGIICFLIFLAFLIGMMVGSVSEKGQKNTD